MTTTISPKSALRRDLRRRRRALDPTQQKLAAQRLYERLSTSSLFRFSKRIAFTMAADGEIDPSMLRIAAQGMGKQCYLPVLATFGPPRLRFKLWRKGEALRRNKYGIEEPRGGRYIMPRALSLVLMPLVGFDASGNRLGMGKGYYDRTFAFRRRAVARRPVLLGLAHECQRVGRLEAEVWDLPLNGVVTDVAWYGAAAAGV